MKDVEKLILRVNKCLELERQELRGNIEDQGNYQNSIDPMKIRIEWRDHYPKLGENKNMRTKFGGIKFSSRRCTVPLTKQFKFLR